LPELLFSQRQDYAPFAIENRVHSCFPARDRDEPLVDPVSGNPLPAPGIEPGRIPGQPLNLLLADLSAESIDTA